MSSQPYDRVTMHPEYARAYQHYLQHGAPPADAARLAYEHTQRLVGPGLAEARPGSRTASSGVVIAVVGGLLAVCGLGGIGLAVAGLGTAAGPVAARSAASTTAPAGLPTEPTPDVPSAEPSDPAQEPPDADAPAPEPPAAPAPEPPAVPAPAPQGAPLVYEVTGSGPASLTYTTDRELTMAQESGVRLPWRKVIDDHGGFLGMSLVAQRLAGGDGSVTCTIKRGDEVLKTVTSRGPYVVAMCTTN